MMDKKEVECYRRLKSSGVDLQKHNQIRYNSGSESLEHIIGKAIVGYIGHTNGYRVSSEVEVGNGEIDIVLWGHPERLSYAVELENNIQEDTLSSKLTRYVHQTNIDDMIVINPQDAPQDITNMTEYIATELGLNYE